MYFSEASRILSWEANSCFRQNKAYHENKWRWWWFYRKVFFLKMKLDWEMQNWEKISSLIARTWKLSEPIRFPNLRVKFTPFLTYIILKIRWMWVYLEGSASIMPSICIDQLNSAFDWWILRLKQIETFLDKNSDANLPWFILQRENATISFEISKEIYYINQVRKRFGFRWKHLIDLRN